MNDRDHARSLLAMARTEFDALAAMQGGLPFADEIFGFHAQQVVEKALKAWIASLALPYPRSHDLMILVDVLGENGRDVEGLAEFVELNSFAVQYRYEAVDHDEELLDRADLVRRLDQLLERVAKAIGA
jgi:HEPN domain-containing protein